MKLELSEGKYDFCINTNCWYIYIHVKNGNIYFVLRKKQKDVYLRKPVLTDVDI